MKQSFTTAIIIFITALLITSCSSSSFITKRRYTKGYYVEHHPGKHSVPLSQTAKKAVKPGTPANTAPAAEAAEVKQEAVAAELVVKTDKTVPAQPKINQKQVLKRLKAPFANTPAELSVREAFKPSHKSLDASKLSADSGDDALSLFWIVILVLLVLWLLGVISGGWGLGILINLLLVFALVLLILWLLRIL